MRNEEAQVTREVLCEHVHCSVRDALDCVERRKRPRHAEFGDLTKGINLWWGKKATPNLRNLGLVIGLRNLSAGIDWRLDFQPTARDGAPKGLHINQRNHNEPAESICHRIVIRGLSAPEGFVFHRWSTWTKINESKAPQDIKDLMKTDMVENYRSLRTILP